jgi:hypothetical protein
MIMDDKLRRIWNDANMGYCKMYRHFLGLCEENNENLSG